MNAVQEREMHDLAVRLETLTRGTGWEAMRYMAIADVLTQLTGYCAVEPTQPEVRQGGRMAAEG